MKKTTNKMEQVIIEQLNFFMDTINEENKIKTRTSKFNPKTGIVLEDKELLDTVFKPGAKMKYGIDTENKILKIMPSDTVGTKVAPRDRHKNGNITSIIHIRRKQIIDMFKDYKELEFEIFEDCIIVKAMDKDINGQTIDSNSYSVSIEDVEALADSKVDEQIRRAIAKHTKQHPILQNIYNVVKEPLKFVSLFSGIGTMDYCFELEGFECALAVELNEAAVKTFKAHSNSPIYHGDVHDVDFESLGEVPLVIGGSPCQDFSANNSRKVWDSPKNKLVYKFIDVVKQVKAKVFLLENVPQILTAGGKVYIQAIKDMLPDFNITIGVLNADNYGSAQSRERAYIVGSRIGEIEMPEPTTPKQEDKKTIREVFDGITENIPNFADWSKPTAKTIERMEYVPQGGNYTDIPVHLRTKGKFSNNYRRLAWNSQSCTIVNVARTIIIHPEHNRVLSVREMARLFSIPDTWEFIGSMFDKQQQVANTVVVEVVNAIAKKIKAKFDEEYDKILINRFSLTSL